MEHSDSSLAAGAASQGQEERLRIAANGAQRVPGTRLSSPSRRGVSRWAMEEGRQEERNVLPILTL